MTTGRYFYVYLSASDLKPNAQKHEQAIKVQSTGYLNVKKKREERLFTKYLGVFSSKNIMIQIKLSKDANGKNRVLSQKNLHIKSYRELNC